MTTTAHSDTPIPDDVLSAALLRSANGSPLGDALPDEEQVEDTETPAPEPVTQTTDAVEPEEDEEADSEEADESEDAQETPDATEDAAPDTPPTPDPFEDAPSIGKPLTYTSDGQSKTFDGIYEIEGKGAVIPQAHLGKLRDVLNRADHATEQNRTLYAKTQEFERVGGIPRIAELEQKLAKLDAAGALFVEMLEQPQMLASLLRQTADGSITIDPMQKQFLLQRMQVAAKEAEFSAREAWEQKQVSYRSESTEASQRESALRGTIEQLADGLPPEDIDAALKHFGPLSDALFRKATPEDVEKWPGLFAIGQTILDRPKMLAWFEDRKALRASQREAQAKREAAAKENAKRAPVVKVATPPKPKPAPKQPRNEDGTFAEKGRKFDRDDFMRAAMRGEPTPGTSDD